MKTFKNLKMSAKLGAIFSLVLLTTMLVGVVGYVSTSRLAEGGGRLAEVSVPSLSAIAEMEAYSRDLRVRTMRLALADSSAAVAKEEKNLAEVRADWNKAVEAFKPTLHSAEEEALFDKTLKAREVQEGYENQILAYAKKGNFKEARELLDGKSRLQFRDEFVGTLEALVKWVEDDSAAMGRSLVSTSSTARSAVIVFTIFAVILGLAGGVLLTKAVVPPVQALSMKLDELSGACITHLEKGLKSMEKGDLTVEVVPTTEPISIDRTDELGKMSSTFNEMLAKVQATVASYQATRLGLGKILAGIQSAADEVSHTGDHLNRASAETGSAAAHIASTITQVSASAEESARSTQQIAEGSESLANAAERAAQAVERLDETILSLEASSLSQLEATAQAIQTAEEGSSAVSRTIQSMERIREQMQATAGAVEELGRKGEQIGVIVQTIEGIAQQTNLLALNAAIEAARAGDQGRGFAVVADEVRKLAEDSTSSAKQIAELISAVQQGVNTAVKAMEASGSEIQEGASLASEAGSSLTAIQSATENVAKTAKSGEATVKTMKGEFRQVSEAIASAAAISQETAAGAEEMSAAAEEVSASAQTVSAAVQQQRAQIEEVADSAEKLNVLASDLKQSVNRFKIESGANHLKLAA